MIIGFAWAFVFLVTEAVQPGSLRFPNHETVVEPSSWDQSSPQRFLYFSFVTLTTLGYGDVTPVLSAARGKAITEAIMGQLFLVVLVARLVAQYTGGARGDVS